MFMQRVSISPTLGVSNRCHSYVGGVIQNLDEITNSRCVMSVSHTFQRSHTNTLDGSYTFDVRMWCVLRSQTLDVSCQYRTRFRGVIQILDESYTFGEGASQHHKLQTCHVCTAHILEESSTYSRWVVYIRCVHVVRLNITNSRRVMYVHQTSQRSHPNTLDGSYTFDVRMWCVLISQTLDVSPNTSKDVCIHIHMYMCVYVSHRIYTYIFICVCMYIDIYICVYTCVCV